MTAIIDAHHHLWMYNSVDYGWMDDSMEVLKRDYLPGDLETERNETSWLLEQAEENSFIKGVVGWLDLRSDEFQSQLDQFTLHPKLVGLRHVIHDEPDDDFMLRPAFLKGSWTLIS